MTTREFIGPFNIHFRLNSRGYAIEVKPKKIKPTEIKLLKIIQVRPKKTVKIKTLRKNAHIEVTGWLDIRAHILERDNYTCQECLATPPVVLTVHHIDKNRLNNADDNLITLCWVCHRRKHW